jgi:DsbC/DsbD-like thiol-disulfide interchange protein
MMKVSNGARIPATIWVAGFLLSLCSAASAADASGWDGGERSAVRLIAGSRMPDAVMLRAGIEIRLKRGWHTYWRYPGDAGVPPKFDFKGSDNLRSLEVLWPAPQRLPVETLVSIGYERDVTFPLRVVPLDPRRPVVLRLNAEYGVCEKLCEPASARAELAVTGDRTSLDGALIAAEAQVPMRVKLGTVGPLRITSVKREAGSPRGRVVVEVAAPPGANVDLFAEGPTAAWAFPVPTPIDGAPPGSKRFAFELDGAPPGAAYENIEITLTATAGKDAIEVTTRLD